MDLDQINALVDTFDKSSLTELSLKRDGIELTLKRETPAPVYTQPMVVHPQAAVPPVASGASAADGSEAAAQVDEGIEVITSPIVGTFYRAPAPDAPPFANDGDEIQKGKPVCIIEAMKVMNELEAEFTMEIVAFRVQNGDMVEYGTPLVEVRRV